MKRQKAREILSRMQKKETKPVVYKREFNPTGKPDSRYAYVPRMLAPRAGYNYQPTEAPW
jgi:hypothetical protein